MSLIKHKNGNSTARTFLSNFFDNDRFFNDRFFRDFSSENDWVPAVNVIDNDNNYTIEVNAPGMKKDDFKINVENGVLNISAATKNESEEKGKNYTRQEFRYESFSRAFTLPENASEEKINAKYENGVLKLELTKKVPVTNKRKEIAVA